MPAKISAAATTASQMRAGVGVKSGGTQGRSNTVSKGVGLNKNSGGLNVFGSGKKIQGVKGPATSKPALKPSSPMQGVKGPATGISKAPKPALVPSNSKGPSALPAQKQNNGYRYVIRGGKRVAVREDLLTPAEKARFSGPATTAPASAAPTASAPTGPTSVGGPVAAATPTGPIDYTGLSSYIKSTADLDREVGNQTADLNAQLAEAQRQYGLQMGDYRRGYERSVETDTNQLNRSNLLRSGHRERMDADRFQQFDRLQQDIEANYGAGATAKINQALARLREWETSQRNAINQQAQSEYNDTYPAAPVDPTATTDAPAGDTGGATSTAPANPTTPTETPPEMWTGGTVAPPLPPGTPPPVAPAGATPPTVVSTPKNTPAPVYGGNGLRVDFFNGSSLMVWDAKAKKNVAKSIDKMTHAEVMAALSRPINQKYIADGYYYANGHIYAR